MARATAFRRRIRGGVTAGRRRHQGPRRPASTAPATCACEEPAVFNVAGRHRLALDQAGRCSAGRRGLIAKRFAAPAAPWVVSHTGAEHRLRGREEDGPWTFNFGSPAVLQPDRVDPRGGGGQAGSASGCTRTARMVAGKENARPPRDEHRAADHRPRSLGRRSARRPTRPASSAA